MKHRFIQVTDMQSNAKYNQVDPDQSQEWLNTTGKKGGGIVGITRTPTALSRWSLCQDPEK
jgi:hypothetical protein